MGKGFEQKLHKRKYLNDQFNRIQISERTSRVIEIIGILTVIVFTRMYMFVKTQSVYLQWVTFNTYKLSLINLIFLVLGQKLKSHFLKPKRKILNTK